MTEELRNYTEWTHNNLVRANDLQDSIALAEIKNLLDDATICIYDALIKLMDYENRKN